MDLFTINIPNFILNNTRSEEHTVDDKITIQKVCNKEYKDFYFSNYIEEDSDKINIHELVLDILKSIWDVEDIMNMRCIDMDMLEIKFATSTSNTDNILTTLSRIGVGVSIGTIIVSAIDILRPRVIIEANKYGNNFVETIRARLAIDKIIDTVRRSAIFNFDYACLVVVASVLSFFGLLYNNPVIIVASMLVSPLMGPIMATTFGIVMGDKKLINLGITSEIISLLICILVGFILGIIISPFQEGFNWISDEMLNRGIFRGLISGILISIPSGVGLAISMLSNNSSSLVGVAISASLLPPAVNSGLMCSIVLYDIIKKSGVEIRMVINYATISFLITLTNIIVIILTGIIMFKLKQVAMKQENVHVWKNIRLSTNDILADIEDIDVTNTVRKINNIDSKYTSILNIANETSRRSSVFSSNANDIEILLMRRKSSILNEKNFNNINIHDDVYKKM